MCNRHDETVVSGTVEPGGAVQGEILQFSEEVEVLILISWRKVHYAAKAGTAFVFG